MANTRKTSKKESIPIAEAKKGRHLTLSDRVKIEAGLKNKDSIRQIAASLYKSPSTVKREIDKHTIVKPAKFNDCLYKNECTVTRLCGIQYCSAYCKKKCASNCMDMCSKYVPSLCERLTQPPYVCNGCGGINNCSLERRIYKADAAENAYRNVLKESRAGFDMTEEQITDISDLVSPLLKKGQSPHSILMNHKEEIGCSLPTFYSLIASGMLEADNFDLRRKVRMKPRKRRRPVKLHNEVKRAMVSKAGRMWEDFLELVYECDPDYVQMDCVEGIVSDRSVLLTLHWPSSRMQIAIKLAEHTSKCVIEALDSLETTLGTDLFREVFPYILTDNGQEFSNINAIETSCLDPLQKRTKVYFCEPNRSDQKGACENNHRLIRYILPKGTSLDKLVQEDVTLMMNHINSYSRNSNFGKTPYKRAMVELPKKFFDLLGLHIIPPDEVELSYSLISRRIKARTRAIDYRLDNPVTTETAQKKLK